MAQTIPQQLAAHIDEACGLHNTGGVSQFFDEDGNLRACQPGESVFAFSIACSLLVYEEDEHNDYKMNVWNMIQGDIDGLNKVQEAVENFKLPEYKYEETPCVVCGKTDVPLHYNRRCANCGIDELEVQS